MEFKKGDIVWAKTASPAMTIKSEHDSPYGVVVLCSWFDKDMNVKEHSFAKEQLTNQKPSHH